MKGYVIIEDDAVTDASEKLAEKIHKLLSAEANLKAYSKQVENYLCLKMYDQAKNWQQAHLELCDEVYSLSTGAFLDFEACLLSLIKLVSILLDMQLFDEALDWTIDALNQLDDGDTYDVLVDQFAICCARLGMSVDSVRDLALKRLCEFTMFDPHYVGDDRMQEYMRSHFENLIDRFNNAVCTMDSGSTASTNNDCHQNGEETKIAQYGELAIALFEDIIQDKSKSISCHDLILAMSVF